MKEIVWYEVWADEGLIPPYILILMCLNDGSSFQVFDPKESQVVHSSNDYESAKYWLLEDEYTSVNGRMFVE
jgi:hypothetical protein